MHGPPGNWGGHLRQGRGNGTNPSRNVQNGGGNNGGQPQGALLSTQPRQVQENRESRDFRNRPTKASGREIGSGRNRRMEQQPPPQVVSAPAEALNLLSSPKPGQGRQALCFPATANNMVNNNMNNMYPPPMPPLQARDPWDVPQVPQRNFAPQPVQRPMLGAVAPPMYSMPVDESQQFHQQMLNNNPGPFCSRGGFTPVMTMPQQPAQTGFFQDFPMVPPPPPPMQAPSSPPARPRPAPLEMTMGAPEEMQTIAYTPGTCGNYPSKLLVFPPTPSDFEVQAGGAWFMTPRAEGVGRPSHSPGQPVAPVLHLAEALHGVADDGKSFDKTYRTPPPPPQSPPRGLSPSLCSRGSSAASTTMQEGGTWMTMTNGSSNSGSVEVSMADPVIGSTTYPSRGSMLHESGACKPCAFVHQGGCTSGELCTFCHLCDAAERKRRKKERRVQKRELRSQAGSGSISQ